MLSIAPPRRPRDLVRYFATHLRPKPYPAEITEPEERPGVWAGSGALALGMWGDVSLQPFSRLLLGLNANEEKLVLNGGDLERRAGWDMVFSAPKSVSVGWALGHEEDATSLMNAHCQAVSETLEQVAQQCLLSRRGKGGKRLENSSMTAATFEHVTNRANDPQLHTHCVILNLCQRQDGTWGCIESRPLFQNRIKLGRSYQQRMGELLTELGYSVERRGDMVRMAWVPIRLEQLFSTRRVAIEQQMRDRGWNSARGAEIAALDSRPEKSRVPLAILRARWKNAANTVLEPEDGRETLSFGAPLSP